ncbi:hypothetical protein OG418_00355 [Streptomyces phaeochromogenes]|uniref:hypothetical protein n=1 Tax=Streptomyces phaeochromogenes TaxID=1923 RepID=UPI003249FE62
MEAQPGERHEVAVVRVDLRPGPPPSFVIVVREVGREASQDRLLGTATSPERVCVILREWLQGMTDG